MPPAANWFLDTGVQVHCADVLGCPPAELAGEIAGNGCTILAHVTCLYRRWLYYTILQFKALGDYPLDVLVVDICGLQADKFAGVIPKKRITEPVQQLRAIGI